LTRLIAETWRQALHVLGPGGAPRRRRRRMGRSLCVLMPSSESVPRN
jgi:hypothetical protein